MESGAPVEYVRDMSGLRGESGVKGQEWSEGAGVE